ncbi:MAG: SRPBCC family protein [Pseudomonadota bacterium]|nr:SRPBCC family protein [Pseudomonadota bacterium]
MASAQTSQVFNCTVEEFYKIISDYEKYPEFLNEVKTCQVIREEGAKKLVEYNISLIKTFSYSLWMSEEPFKKISWMFASGDIFKTMSGYWELAEEAGLTRATYFLDASFGLFVPGPIAKGIVNANLPNMISAYQKRVKELYGK